MNLKAPALAVAAACAVAITGWPLGNSAASADRATPNADTQAHTSAKPKPAERQHLNILLTNDDGWSAPGINAAYEALTAAGHDVTMVAPKTNQSGMSAAMPDGELHVEQPTSDPKIFNVNSSPATSMDVGVRAILDEKPDLVISGINSGANAGGFIALSGTVGATVAARSLYGLPGIAISLEQESNDKSDYLDAARLLVDIVDRGIDFIQDGTVLNVNFPDLDPGHDAPTDVVYAEPSNAVPVTWDYTLHDDGSLDFAYAAAELPRSGDIAELAKDRATLTLIRTTAGGLGVPAPHAQGVRRLAANLD